MSDFMSVPPVSQSPLYKYGKSLSPGRVSARRGLASALADAERAPDQAKVLNNLQMWRKRYIWSSHGIGYTIDNETAINGGTQIYDFGIFVSTTGVETVLLQVDDEVYPYDFATHTEGAAITGLTALVTTQQPCMRAFSPSNQTAQPITIYCNGDINPRKITTTAASSALTWTNGKYTETATIAGTIAAGNVVTISMTSTSLIISPRTVSYTCQTGDTATIIATALATAINNDPTLASVGLYATAAAAVITIIYPQILGAVTFGQTAGGSVTNTLSTPASSSSWPLTFNGKTYQKPKFVEIFNDRAVFAGFPDASTMFDVIVTKAGSAENFETNAPIFATDAFAYTVPAENGAITGIRSHRPSNTDIGQVFLIGQTRGVMMITGSDTTNYRLDYLTKMFGVFNNRTWVQVFDDLLFLTRAGIYSFSSLVQNKTAPEDAVSWVVKDRIESIDWDNAADAFAVHHPVTQEIQFWAPWVGDSGECKHGLILCYNTEGGIGAPVWSSKDSLSVSCAIDWYNTLYMGDYLGRVQKHYDGDLFDGETIPFAYRSAVIAVGGNMMQGGRIKQYDVITDGQAQQFSITSYAYVRFADGTTRRVPMNPLRYTLRDSTPGVTIFPFVLGVSNFPADFLKKHTFSPIGRGFAFEVELSNTSVAGDGLDFSRVEYTLSVGGITRR